MYEEIKINKFFIILMALLCGVVSLAGTARFIWTILNYHNLDALSDYSKCFFTLIGFIIYYRNLKEEYGKYQTLKIIYLCFFFALLSLIPFLYIVLCGKYEEQIFFGILCIPSFFYLVYISYIGIFFTFSKSEKKQYSYMKINKKISIVMGGYVVLFILFGTKIFIL